jgi:hypothetical protein
MILSRSFQPAKRELEQHRRRESVDVAFPAFRRAARPAPHLVDGSQRRRRGVSLIDELHGQAGSLREGGSHGASLGRPRRLVAIAVER